MSLQLPSFSLFAGLLAVAGLPIYIHAPKFYVDEYGVSLAALGVVLFGLRLFDFVQDPVLGWLSNKFRALRGQMVTVAVFLMAFSMFALFAIEPPINALIWFAITLCGLFTSFSFLTINFYAQGVSTATILGGNGHLRLAAWRETGALIGVCLASVAPTVLAVTLAAPFTGFAIGFAVMSSVAVLAMHREWDGDTVSRETGFSEILRDANARRLLLIALINAAPVAVSSTLFLFFVESRLLAQGWEGPLLLLFFLAAAAAAPIWSKLAQKYGAKPMLINAMVLAIAAFSGALFLSEGDVFLFALVCLGSGAALGADMTLLPAMFAARMEKIAPNATQAFGLWSFVSKFTLAFAAVALLPLLESAGFQAGTSNSAPTLMLLTLLYAAVPCVLKLVSLVLLALTPIEEV